MAGAALSGAALSGAALAGPALVAAALGDIARAKGMTQIARETGLGRESLYKALSPEGNPELVTLLKVVRAHHWVGEQGPVKGLHRVGEQSVA